MYKFNRFVQDSAGNIITSGTCTVWVGNTNQVTKAVLFQDNQGTTLANPLTINTVDGRIEFYLANQTFDITVVTSSGTTLIKDLVAFDEIANAFTSASAPAIPATGITFTQSGTGAVARTVQNKLQEVVTSADFSSRLPGSVGVGTGGMLSAVTTGINNTALGDQTLKNNTTGNSNVAVGFQALAANTTGGSLTFGGNTAVGVTALVSNTIGDNNTAIGIDALYTNTDGYSNTAIGSNALGFGDHGYENVAVGWRAGFNAQGGHTNTAIGIKSLNTGGGNSNVALGAYAGYYETGSNAFYVNNQDRGSLINEKVTALLYGTFNATPANQTLTVNGVLTPVYGLSSVDIGVSGTNDLFSVTGLASGSGVSITTQNNLKNAFRPLAVTGTAIHWGYAGGADVFHADQFGLHADQGLTRTITAQPGPAYTVAATDTHIISNGAATLTLTLPAPASYNGREITVRTVVNQAVISASSNVVPLAGGIAGTAILAATAGKFALLVSDGTNWQVQMGN